MNQILNLLEDYGSFKCKKWTLELQLLFYKHIPCRVHAGQEGPQAPIHPGIHKKQEGLIRNDPMQRALDELLSKLLVNPTHMDPAK